MRPLSPREGGGSARLCTQGALTPCPYTSQARQHPLCQGARRAAAAHRRVGPEHHGQRSPPGWRVRLRAATAVAIAAGSADTARPAEPLRSTDASPPVFVSASHGECSRQRVRVRPSFPHGVPFPRGVTPLVPHFPCARGRYDVPLPLPLPRCRVDHGAVLCRLQAGAANRAGAGRGVGRPAVARVQRVVRNPRRVRGDVARSGREVHSLWLAPLR